MIKVGVIGYGYSARTFHIPLILATKSLQLTAISSSQRELVMAAHPQIEFFSSAEALIASGSIDLVVITAPNEVHYPLAKQCLENGVHVVLEKPMVTTSRTAQDLVRLARERALVLSVFHNRRWDGDFLTVEKLLEQKLLGEVRFFESHFDRFRPAVRPRWREQPGEGTGVWFDLGSHLVDQALCLFGRPDALTARCLPLRDGSNTTDYFHVMLHYQKLEVVLHASPFSAAPNVRFRLEGNQGSYLKYGLDPQEEQLKQGLSPLVPAFGRENAAQFGRLYSEASSELIETEVGCYQQYYTMIAEAINSGGANPVDSDQVVDVIRILELAEESSGSGRTIALSQPID